VPGFFGGTLDVVWTLDGDTGVDTILRLAEAAGDRNPLSKVSMLTGL
jgi:hypothetical protein